MEQTMTQAIIWVATLGALVLYMARRKKRKANY